MLWPVERFVRRHYAWLTLLALVALVWFEVDAVGFAFLYWDWLFVSGVVVLLAALRLALELPDQAAKAMRSVEPEHVDRLHRAARKLSVVWAVITVLVLATAWLVSGLPILPDRILIVSVELVGAAFAGLFIGRAVSYSQLRHVVTDRSATRRLYLFHGAVLGLPAVFLAVWWSLFTAIGAYPHWRDSYGVLFLLVCALIVVVCLRPLVSWENSQRR